MKRIKWFKASLALLTGLLVLMFFSCQKYEENLLNQQSINGKDRMAIKACQGNAQVLYYGHKIFKRFKGKPFVVTQKIENPEVELFNENFVLMILNGDKKKTRVSSAEIRIDGKLIVGQAAFLKMNHLSKKDCITLLLNQY